MSRIKVKDMEGDPEDIQSLLKENNVNLGHYLGAEPARKQVKNKWIFILIISLFILSCCIWNDTFNSVWMKVSILATFFLSFYVLLIAHSNYRSKVITAIVAAALIVNILVILKVYSPQEITKKIETMISEKASNK